MQLLSLDEESRFPEHYTVIGREYPDVSKDRCGFIFSEVAQTCWDSMSHQQNRREDSKSLAS
jgi:hypothetical protein